MCSPTGMGIDASMGTYLVNLRSVNLNFVLVEGFEPPTLSV